MKLSYYAETDSFYIDLSERPPNLPIETASSRLR